MPVGRIPTKYQFVPNGVVYSAATGSVPVLLLLEH
jgi:hypothetical protein